MNKPESLTRPHPGQWAMATAIAIEYGAMDLYIAVSCVYRFSTSSPVFVAGSGYRLAYFPMHCRPRSLSIDSPSPVYCHRQWPSTGCSTIFCGRLCPSMDHLSNLLSPTTVIDGCSPQSIVAAMSIDGSHPQAIVTDNDHRWILATIYRGGNVYRWITSPTYCHRQWPSMDTPHNLLWQAMSIDCYRPQIFYRRQCPSVGTAHHLLSSAMDIDRHTYNVLC